MELHIQPLDSALHDRAGFDCGVVELNDYLKKRARKEASSGIAACFVATWSPKSSEIIGYYTLSSATILRSDLPEKMTRRLPRYPELPATLLGRLAVESASKGGGIGSQLLFSAMSRSLIAAIEVGSLAVVTDPKDEAAERFYCKFGFQILDSERLFISMKEINKMLNAQ